MLSDNADKIFRMKYAQNLSDGSKETWEQAVGRVSEYVARAETTDANYKATIEAFFRVIYEKSFLPGGRTLANAGTSVKNLLNCFVLPIEDSREGIYSTLKDAAEVFAWGGGVGYNFSHLREDGAQVVSTDGKASGPLSFMSLYDQTGEVISQASRRGAQMGILNIDHPDIIEFINYKNELNPRNLRLYKEYLRNLETVGLDRDGKKYFQTMEKTLADDQLTHFNISVGISDFFMRSVTSGGVWDFTSVITGEHIPFMGRAEDLLGLIARNAWENGDPGIFFLDRANADNLVPYLGRIEATNPCGEVPLLAYEGCCLGSLNLNNFVDGKFFDWEYLQSVIMTAVRFLDNVQELNETPVGRINIATRRTRRLGLGVMGLADCLAEMELPYDSVEARKFCEELAFFIGKISWYASMKLAEERGPFPVFDEHKVNWSVIDKFGLDRRPPRNVAITSIAPTGTIALICDVNGGIEPYFALSYRRNITEGIGNTAKKSIKQDIPLVAKAKENGWSDKKIAEVFRTSHDIHWKDHIMMQAVWQKYTDNAVSKTINMPRTANVDDIMDAYLMAWEVGLKGITVYRDGSKLFQILNKE